MIPTPGEHSTGGRPPYGFGRFLVDAAGTTVEELPEGRKVKEAGCHVRFLPNNEAKIGIWVRMLEWLEAGWGFKRVAEHLNELGIPGPDAGRHRGGRKFGGRVSGKWNHNTVRSLAMNALIIGEKEYGRFSQGMHHRLGPHGPRAVNADELLDDGAGRIIENDSDVRIRAESGGGAFFDPELACPPQTSPRRIGGDGHRPQDSGTCKRGAEIGGGQVASGGGDAANACSTRSAQASSFLSGPIAATTRLRSSTPFSSGAANSLHVTPQRPAERSISIRRASAGCTATRHDDPARRARIAAALSGSASPGAIGRQHEASPLDDQRGPPDDQRRLSAAMSDQTSTATFVSRRDVCAETTTSHDAMPSWRPCDRHITVDRSRRGSSGS